MERIKVSDNRRFLVTESGKPFFWLGDTAWEIFHRLDRAEVARYFQDRQAKQFNVIQAVALAEMDGLRTPNRYGELPLHNEDPTRPNDAYFDYVDEVIQLAATHGFYIGLVPTWGDKILPLWAAGPVVFDEHNAYPFGRYLGERYRDRANIVWILGGDRPLLYQGSDFRPIWHAMARGIQEGTGGKALMTYHIWAGNSSSKDLHDAPWLDFNMMQSGHVWGRDKEVWEMIQHDYNLHPIKPTLDGEPNYEGHPLGKPPDWTPEDGYFTAYDVRKQAYRSVFAGGFGVTHGHHAIWPMWDEKYPRRRAGEELMPWYEALDAPAAGQMRHLRALMESRPILTRIPDQSLLVSDPGSGGAHIRATRDSGGRYAFLYLPTPRPVTVALDAIAGEEARAAWYDPRTGAAHNIGVFSAEGEQTFAPPPDGPDWVLVLDDAVQDFAPPGSGLE